MCAKESAGGGGEEEIHQAELWDLCVGFGGGTQWETRNLNFPACVTARVSSDQWYIFPGRLLCQLYPCWRWNVFNGLNLNIWAQKLQDGGAMQRLTRERCLAALVHSDSDLFFAFPLLRIGGGRPSERRGQRRQIQWTQTCCHPPGNWPNMQP